MEVLVVYGCKHPEGDVHSVALVEDLHVLEERGGELDSGAPLLPVEQFCTQPALE
jgi:hypothetical protein